MENVDFLIKRTVKKIFEADIKNSEEKLGATNLANLKNALDTTKNKISISSKANFQSIYDKILWTEQDYQIQLGILNNPSSTEQEKIDAQNQIDAHATQSEKDKAFYQISKPIVSDSIFEDAQDIITTLENEFPDALNTLINKVYFLEDSQEMWIWDKRYGGNLTESRVIAFRIADDEVIIPIAEDLIFTKINTRNVSALYIKPDDGVSDWEPVEINNPIIKNISKDYDLAIKIERILSDPYASVYIFATKIN